MIYQENLNWMLSRLPMYQRKGSIAYKKNLFNTLLLAKRLNHPQNNFKSIHIGGTNGKGSSSHMLASVLQEAGYKVGLYTSPHLKDFRERIKINGREISKEKVSKFIAANKSFLEDNSLSFFEMTVGLCFEYFSEEKVDFAVVEVGLGGSLDSTNILEPEVSVITNVGFDHTQFLGNTLEKIAFTKGGIIKEKTPVVIGEYQKETFPIFKQRAIDKNAALYLASEQVVKNYISDLKGNYQNHNIKTVIQTLDILKKKGFKISKDSIERGLRRVVLNTGLSGRWQTLKKEPKIICDIAHNKEGLFYTMKQLEKETFDNLHIVLGMVNDKYLEPILPLFPSYAHYYFCSPNVERGLEVETLQQQAIRFGLQGNCFHSVNQAYKKAKKKAAKKDCIYVGGSSFVVAEIL